MLEWSLVLMVGRNERFVDQDKNKTLNIEIIIIIIIILTTQSTRFFTEVGEFVQRCVYALSISSKLLTELTLVIANSGIWKTFISIKTDATCDNDQYENTITQLLHPQQHQIRGVLVYNAHQWPLLCFTLQQDSLRLSILY